MLKHDTPNPTPTDNKSQPTDNKNLLQANSGTLASVNTGSTTQELAGNSKLYSSKERKMFMRQGIDI